MEANLPHFQLIARTSLRVWPGNPRRTVTGVDDLAVSIAAKGMRVPMLVRPLGAEAGVEGEVTHEILAGQRRYLAATIAGLTELPCMVQDVADDAALEIALTENTRDDVPPLEEAEAISLLVLAHHRTPQDVAAKLGRGLRWVVRRLALLTLCPEARAALVSGRLPLAHAERLAAVSTAIQARVLSIYPEPTEFPVARRFVEMISYELHSLADAPFEAKDADLGGHGACVGCPHRSDTQQDLFGDAMESAHCLDPACWDTKVATNWERAQKTATRKHLTVIANLRDVSLVEGYDGKVAVSYGGSGPYVPEKPSPTAKPVAIARTEKGRVVELYARPTKVEGSAAEGAAIPGEDDDGDVSEEDHSEAMRAQRAKAREAREDADRVTLRSFAAVLAENPQAMECAARIALHSTGYDFGLPVVRSAVNALPLPIAHLRDIDEHVAAVPSEDLPRALLVALTSTWLLDPDAENDQPWEKELRALLAPSQGVQLTLGDTKPKAAPEPSVEDEELRPANIPTEPKRKPAKVRPFRLQAVPEADERAEQGVHTIVELGPEGWELAWTAPKGSNAADRDKEIAAIRRNGERFRVYNRARKCIEDSADTVQTKDATP